MGWPWTEEAAQLPGTMPGGRSWPRVSIVTPNYNYGRFIEETIRSVLLQGYPDLEYIVMDGASTDESVGVIKKYERWLTYWESVPDRGQAHAINKGLSLATGEIFQWINADDLVERVALALIGASFIGCDAVAGGVTHFGPGSGDIVCFPQRLSASAMILREPGTVFRQPGLWLRRPLVAPVGGLEEDLHYAFDWDLAIRYLHAFPRVRYMPKIVAKFRHHEDSKTVSQGPKFDDDEVVILERILQCAGLSQLHAACDMRLRTTHWWRVLEGLRGETGSPRWIRAASILCQACRDPRVRCSRYTGGALKRVLLADERGFYEV